MMEDKTLDFKREALYMRCAYNKELTYDLDSFPNYILQTLKTYIYSSTERKESFNYTFDPPTFLEWLLRKKREVTLKVVYKDVLVDPQEDPVVTVRFYSNDISRWS